MNILDKIVASTRERVKREKREMEAGWQNTGSALRREKFTSERPCGALTLERQREAFSFERSLRQPGFHFICEIKKASPSKGVIAEDFPYQDIARDYQKAGAAAISVLTEPEFFQGCAAYLTEIRDIVDIPLLRKDFIIDPFQIEQSSLLGADAILLICAILSPAELSEFIRLADGFGLSCLVEAHDENEVQLALGAGARIVGVNNRDLKTFMVDTGVSVRLRKLVPEGVVFVSESGISAAGDVDLLRRNGVNAALVGESLMRAPDKVEALARLRGDLVEQKNAHTRQTSS